MSRIADKSLRDQSPAIVPGHRVIQTTEVARIGGPHAHAQQQQPTIDLVREGDVIKAIDVTCSCGEKFRLWCSYEAS